jgi:hypothetical protein
MKLQTLFETRNHIFSVTFKNQPLLDKLVYTFAVRKVGEDGMGRPVYVGHCNVHDDKDGENNNMFAAVVMRPDGSLYAAQYRQTMADAVRGAGIAIAKQHRAYGPDYRNKDENWSTYRTDSTNVDGYDATE